ncbi:hypothetical protein WH47_02964, partial [Habropoda laboriosa]
RANARYATTGKVEGNEGRLWKRPQPYIGGLLYRTFTLQSCGVIYGCRSLIRRIRTPLSPHVCCPSIDPIYSDETGVHEVSPRVSSWILARSDSPSGLAYFSNGERHAESES